MTHSSEKLANLIFSSPEFWNADGLLLPTAFDRIKERHPQKFEEIRSLAAEGMSECDSFKPRRHGSLPFGDSNLHLAASCKEYRGILDNCLLSFRLKWHQAQGIRADKLWKDRSLVIEMPRDAYQEYSQRSIGTRNPIFVSYAARHGLILNLGYYVAERHVGHGIFKFVPCNDQKAAREAMGAWVKRTTPQSLAPLSGRRRSRSRSPHPAARGERQPSLCRVPNAEDVRLAQAHMRVLEGMRFEYENIADDFPLDGCAALQEAPPALWKRFHIPRGPEKEAEVLELVLTCTSSPITEASKQRFEAITAAYGQTILCISGSPLSAEGHVSLDSLQFVMWKISKESDKVEQCEDLMWRMHASTFFLGQRNGKPCVDEITSIKDAYREAYDAMKL
jgi:hypothetical protein